MTTVQATVNTRLLSKASRLFTGTLNGRIIEILQNARRAGARHVKITNHDGVVTVRDDGRGIDDFAKLLDLGGSDWQENLEASEDPAGVGLFCLAPRELSIRSRGQKITIGGDGWTGSPVELSPDRPLRKCGKHIPAGAGTELTFKDEPWEANSVQPQAVFTGLQVEVDGEPCPSEPFIAGRGKLYRELGCRIQVVEEKELSGWQRRAASPHLYSSAVLLNFHGQVVSFCYGHIAAHGLHFLVDMTGGTTGIRLMLPARTQLVENEVFTQLKAVLEREAFLYIKKHKKHTLPYAQYLRARELGIKLPEATPTYRVGLLFGGMDPQPVEVAMPDGYRLSRCYRLADIKTGNESDEANVHLLAALGQFKQPFVPVEIHNRFDGYSWAKLPMVGRVKVEVGKQIQDGWIDGGKLICVESITISAQCSDGKVFRSDVPMAVRPVGTGRSRNWADGEQVYVTPQARQRLTASQIWYHFGGFSEEGDAYETQEADFVSQLDEFWQRLHGPYEQLRAKLAEGVAGLVNWESVTIHPDHRIVLRLADGAEQVILPPDGQIREEAAT